MEQERGFFVSFEVYIKRIVGKSTLPYLWVVFWFLFLVLTISLGQETYSLAGATTIREVVRQAAQQGDYSLAQRLYTGESGLEDLVYPEKKIDIRITELENKLTIYPGDRDIYLALETLYGERGNQDKANEYREKARILDPNN